LVVFGCRQVGFWLTPSSWEKRKTKRSRTFWLRQSSFWLAPSWFLAVAKLLGKEENKKIKSIFALDLNL